MLSDVIGSWKKNDLWTYLIYSPQRIRQEAAATQLEQTTRTCVQLFRLKMYANVILSSAVDVGVMLLSVNFLFC